MHSHPVTLPEYRFQPTAARRCAQVPQQPLLVEELEGLAPAHVEALDLAVQGPQ